MNILVTGGEGFIGKKLVNRLIKEGHNVTSLDKTESEDIIADLSSENFFFDAINLDIDYIFHLAAQSGGYYSLKDPYIDGKWNCLGTINVVKLAQKLKVKKLVYISSMAIYGNQELVSEEHSNIPYTIFRLFATYGSGQDLDNKHQGILSIYLDQALNKDTIEITGSEDRVRELVHVDDVIEALMLSFNSETNNEIYNVSNSEHLTP